MAENFQGPSSANVGQRVTAEVTIRNRGGVSGEVIVQYRISSQTVATKLVSVDANSSVNVTLSGDVPTVSSGETTQGIHLDGASPPAASSTIFINPSSARVVVESITGFTTEGRRGDTVSITATVANIGEAPGESTFQFRIAQLVVAERQGVQLNPGERRTITLQGTVPNLPAGRYLQGVFVGTSNVGATSSFTVVSEPATFEVETFEGPSRAQRGSTVTARARVRNTGQTRGTATFQYRIDGSRVTTREVTLNSGETQTLSFEGTVPDRSPGVYTQGVFVGDTNRGRTAFLTIDEDPAAKFSISNLRAPIEAEIGSQITVRATVTNTGNTRQETRIEYRIDGSRYARQDVDLRAGESVSLTFDVTVPELRRGTYEQGVFVGQTSRGQTTSLTIRERAQVTLSGLNAPPSATVGDQVTAQATLRNRGTGRVTRTAEYRIGNRVIDRREIQLDGSESRSFRFEGTVPEIAAGNYTQGIYVERESITATLEVRAKPVPRPAFSVTEFSGAQGGIAGTRVTAEATVRNTGNAGGSTTLDYRIGERVVSTRQVSLDAGAQRTVTFEGTVPDRSPGTYQHGVFIAGTTQGRTRQFTIRAGEPRFSISNVQAPASGMAGDSIDVSATVTNTGTGPGETDIQYRFDGDRRAGQTIELEAGESTDLTFTVDVPDLDAGTYSHGVFVGSSNQGQTTSFVIEAAPTPTPTPTDDAAPGFGIVGTLTGIGGASYLLKRHLGDEESEEE